MSEWQPIETAPKTNEDAVHYILITDGVCLPSIVSWRAQREAYADRFGTLHLQRPAGWFESIGIRSRLCASATHWMPLPQPPANGNGE